MDYIFCGIKLKQNYEKIRVENVNFNESSAALKERVRNEFLLTEDVTLVYCGNILEDDEPINKYKLRTGSIIHVLKKKKTEEPKTYPKFTELDVARICAMYKGLNSGNFHKISRPEVIQAIFSKHPELQKDIIALSFVKDPILLANLQNPDTVRKLAENHRVLIEASETICKALSMKHNIEEEPNVSIPLRLNFDDVSDSSSSGSEANSPQASNSNIIRRITSDYLRRSLAAAVQQNQNSLASISQRNLNQSGIDNFISPSTSSSSVPQRRNLISSSMLNDAMNGVMNDRRSESEVVEGEETVAAPPIHPSSSSSSLAESNQDRQQSQEPEEIDQMEEDEDERDAREIAMIASFRIQLQQMEEMGLTNKATNIQALMVCNGNLEAAVNLVLTEMNMN